MMTTSTTPPPSQPFRRLGLDRGLWRVISLALVVVVALLSWWFVRSQLVTPFDNFMMGRQCTAHGATIERDFAGLELNTDDGEAVENCLFQPVEEGGSTLTVAIETTESTPLFRAGRVISLILQFGLTALLISWFAPAILDIPNRVASPSFDPVKLILVALLVLVAFFALSYLRDRLVHPAERLVTEQVCLDHGEEIGRDLVGFEQPDRFLWRVRAEGSCSYAAGPEGEPATSMTIEETVPGPLYRLANVISVIVQLGIISVVLRLITDPILDLYRALRRFVPAR